MAIIGALEKPFGRGAKYKVAAGTASVADGGEIDTGFRAIVAAVVIGSNPDHIVAITGISGGKITVGIHDTAGAAVTTAETVYYIAIGY